MLKTTKKLSFTGESVIEGNTVCVFSASIPIDDPEKTTIGNYQKDKEAYQAHREECRADYAAFEDMVLAEKDKLLEEKK